MNAAFFGVITLCFVLYFNTKSKRWSAVATYFILQVVLEFIIRTTEVHNSLTVWFNHVFGELTVVKGFFYSVLIFDMVLVLCFVLDLKLKLSYVLAPAMISFFLITVSMVQEKNMIFYGIYFVPCELFYIGWSAYGLKKIKEKENASSYRVLRTVLLVMIVSTLIILVEDFWTSWQYGLYNTFVGCTDPSNPHAYIKARSYSESVLQIVLAGFTFYAGGSSLAKRRVCVQSGEEKSDRFVETWLEEKHMEPSSEEKRSRFAEDFALSGREKEVLPMLLDNYSMQEISTALSISQGTVKYHTHNIYQKAGVGDRVELILKVDSYL